MAANSANEPDDRSATSITSKEPGSLDVIVIGQTIVDTTIVSPRVEVGGKIFAQSMHTYAGGQGANAAACMAALGLKVTFAGRFGDDPEADFARQSLQMLGVGTDSSVFVVGASTPRAFVLVDPDNGERDIYMYRDEGLEAVPLTVSPEVVARTKMLYLDGYEVTASMQAATVARRAGTTVLIDLEYCSPTARELASHATLLVVGQGVMSELGGSEDLESALRNVLGEYPALQVAVATRGAAGAVALTRDGRLISTPAAPAVVSDTTGAGDAFRAGLVAGSIIGLPLERALEFGAKVAAIKCATPGPRAPQHVMTELRRELMSY
jgi:sulfofructose kinase